MVAHTLAYSWQWSDVTLGELTDLAFEPSVLATVVVSVLAALLSRTMWNRWTAPRAVTFNWPAPAEAELDWSGRVIEDPSLDSHEKDVSLLGSNGSVSADGGKDRYLTCYDPSTAFHLETRRLRSKDEINTQIQSAHDAQPAWRRTTFSQRRQLLLSLRAWILRDMDAICRVACRDTGKTRVDAVLGEIMTTMEKIDWLLSYGEQTLSPSSRSSPWLLLHKKSIVHYEPLGLVAALVSWNYSFHNLISPVLAALSAGNTIVVKCSEQVAWSSEWYMGGIKACLRACGMNDNVVQLVVCLPDLAETVTKNPLVRHITFIGSEPVGKMVAAAAAEMMIPTCIELGGKDPAFILPSADLDFFASTLLRGVYQSAGQNCIGIELIVLPRSLLDKFLSLAEPRIKALRPGHDVGSLISQQPIARLEAMLTAAEKQGAEIRVGGQRYYHPDRPNAAYFAPTLVVNADMSMDIVRQELFAPVMSVVCYDEVDKAVDMLNSSRYGLGASVFGNDKAECLSVASRLQCGMVSINDFGVFYLNQAMPFGGVKASGHGRFGGEEGLRGLCTPKAIIHDRFFDWVRTPIPKPVDFPLPHHDVAFGFLHGLVWMAYGSASQRISGIWELIRSSSK